MINTAFEQARHRRWTAVEAIGLNEYAKRGDNVVCPACAATILAHIVQPGEIIYVGYTCPSCLNTALFGFAELTRSEDFVGIAGQSPRCHAFAGQPEAQALPTAGL